MRRLMCVRRWIPLLASSKAGDQHRPSASNPHWVASSRPGELNTAVELGTGDVTGNPSPDTTRMRLPTAPSGSWPCVRSQPSFVDPPDKETIMQAAQLTTYTSDDLMISSPDKGLVLKLANFAIGGEPVPVAPQAIDIPAIGEYWPGQGGIYAGIRQYPDGLHHVIFATEDVGDHAYGEYGTAVGATSKVDGRLNTDTLHSTDGSFPAASAASNYTADGHADFYLPAIGELNHAWQNIAEHFSKDCYYLSSTQRSANLAFLMTFDGGNQTNYFKTLELRVRPVRRFLR